MFKALLCPSSGAQDYMCVLFLPMVCSSERAKNKISVKYHYECSDFCRGYGVCAQGYKAGKACQLCCSWELSVLVGCSWLCGCWVCYWDEYDRRYIPWLLVVWGQVQSSTLSVQEEGCCTTGFVKWYREGEWPFGTEGSGRLRIVWECASLSGEELQCGTVPWELAFSG